MNLGHAFEVVVVGAGPAGVAAACVAAESGRRVALVDSAPWTGGQIWRTAQSQRLPPQAQKWLARLDSARVQVLGSTCVLEAPTTNTLFAETASGESITISWDKLILAVGARELFIPFPGWTLPNVFGPGGLQVLVKGGWPITGKRIVVAGTGPLLLAAAAYFKSSGAEVLLVAEQASWKQLVRFAAILPGLSPAKLTQAAVYRWKLLGVPYYPACWPIEAQGHDKVERVTLRRGHREWSVECDLLACAFGLIPNLELPLLLGCLVEHGFVKVNRRQETSVPCVYACGEITGIGGVDRALIEGRIAGYAASGQTRQAERRVSARGRADEFTGALNRAFALRKELKDLASPDTIICRCEDVARRQLDAYNDWRSAKLHTRCGMGACQGRVCGAATRFLFGWGPDSVRPPIFPASIGVLAELSSRNPGASAEPAVTELSKHKKNHDSHIAATGD